MSVQQRRLSRPLPLAKRGVQTILNEAPTHWVLCVGVNPQLARDLDVRVAVVSGEKDQRMLETPGLATPPASQPFQLCSFVGYQMNNALLQPLFPLPARSGKSLHQLTTEINVAVY